MDAEQLSDLARRAASYTGHRQILVLGSQAVHGALPEVPLPEITTMSIEADLVVVNDLTGDAPHAIEAQFGMGSPYHQHHGVYADGVSLSELVLPEGWKGRVRSRRIDDPANADRPVTVLFPEIHDLCASKLTVAVTGGFGRRSDRAFVQALAEAGLIDLDVLEQRIDQFPDSVHPQVREAAHRTLNGLR